MVTEAVSTRVLDAKYPTTKDLGKVIKNTSSNLYLKVNENPDLNKKAFQFNVNRLLADCTGYKVNKFEHVRAEWVGASLYSMVQVEQV